MKNKFLRGVLSDVLLFSLFSAILIFFSCFVVLFLVAFSNYIFGGKMPWSSMMDAWLTISLLLSSTFFIYYVLKYLWPVKSHFKKWLKHEISTCSKIIDCHQKTLLFKEEYEVICNLFESEVWIKFCTKCFNLSVHFVDLNKVELELKADGVDPGLIEKSLPLVHLYKERLRAEFKKMPYNDFDDYTWLLPSLLVSKDIIVLEIKKYNELIALYQQELNKL
ncbi:MAG: hypothetical protein WCK37_00830 [Candidatus Falkowbacteria bacterium]